MPYSVFIEHVKGYEAIYSQAQAASYSCVGYMQTVAVKWPVVYTLLAGQLGPLYGLADKVTVSDNNLGLIIHLTDVMIADGSGKLSEISRQIAKTVRLITPCAALFTFTPVRTNTQITPKDTKRRRG